MRDWLESVGGPTLVAAWDVLVEVGVPILAAGIAAWFVARQISQAEKHRKIDRAAQAILELNDMASKAARLVAKAVEAADAGGAGPTQLDRFELNNHYVRALALLSRKDQDVARWANLEVQQIFENVFGSQPTMAHDTTGMVRAEAMAAAAQTSQELLQWQRGKRRRRWFREQIQR